MSMSHEVWTEAGFLVRRPPTQTKTNDLVLDVEICPRSDCQMHCLEL